LKNRKLIGIFEKNNTFGDSKPTPENKKYTFSLKKSTLLSENPTLIATVPIVLGQFLSQTYHSPCFKE
jgi:hypothetical protein